MSGIVAAAGVVGSILKRVRDSGDDADLLSIVKGSDIKLMKADGSMLKLLGKYIVEPVIVVSNDLRHEEILDKVLELHTDMFTGFYMQMFSILTNQYGVDSNIAIDALATDSSGLSKVMLKGAVLALENNEEDFFRDVIEGEIRLSTEVDEGKLRKVLTVMQGGIKDSKSTGAKNSADIETLKNKANRKVHGKRQATGRISDNELNVPSAIVRSIELVITNNIIDGGKVGTFDIVIPITVKTHVLFTDRDNIVNALAPGGDNATFSAGLDDYRSGAKSLLDFITGSSLVKEYKKTKLKDKDGLLALINARRISANSKAVTTGFVGFEKYYNMFVISAYDKAVIEKTLRGKLSSSKVKEKLLTQLLGLSVTVMDSDAERIRIAYKDLKGVTDLSYKGAIKAAKGGSDVSEIIKAFMANKPPVY